MRLYKDMPGLPTEPYSNSTTGLSCTAELCSQHLVCVYYTLSSVQQYYCRADDNTYNTNQVLAVHLCTVKDGQIVVMP